MKSRALVVGFALCAVTACKAKGTGKEGEPSAAAPVSATALPSAEVQKKNEPVEVKGDYDAKLGAVQVPTDAPKFVDVDVGAVGAGTLVLSLPSDDGEVLGKANGALGEQIFSGYLEKGTLTGSLTPDVDSSGAAAPDSGASSRMWGVVSATVEGNGAARVVRGTVRASNQNGRIVRDAAFMLKKQ